MELQNTNAIQNVSVNNADPFNFATIINKSCEFCARCQRSDFKSNLNVLLMAINAVCGGFFYHVIIPSIHSTFLSFPIQQHMYFRFSTFYILP